MAKKIKKNHTTSHPEIKGLLIMALAALMFLALFSFNQSNYSKNYLGYIGNIFAFCLTYLFGLGSYLLSIFLGVIGWQTFSKDKYNFLPLKIFCFFFIIISACFVLNIFSELYPAKAIAFENNVYIETVFHSKPSPYASIRYNLGGAPFYYLYKDLPYFNLHKLLSNVGIVIIFTITGLLSFLIITGIELLPNFKKASKTLSLSSRKINDNIVSKTPQAYSFIKSCINFLKTKTKKTKINKTAPIPIQKKILQKPIIKPLPMPSFKEIKRDKQTRTFPSFLKKEKQSTNYYDLPSSELLSNPPEIDHPQLQRELTNQALILEETLKNFGIQAKVGDINCGPTVTLFEVHPSVGVKVQKIKSLENDIALNLQAKSIRIIAPIPGKAAVGVEIPSIYPQTVTIKEMLLHYYNQKKKLSIPLLLGKTVTGGYVITDLVKTPHLLIAGATGSGKSVCINTIVMSILMNNSPDLVKLIMIDPKKVELTQYSPLPHMIAPVVTEPHGAYSALHFLVKEMQTRYDILKLLKLRNITAFNQRKIDKQFEASLNIPIPIKMPLIVAIIDEFADLMMVSSTDIETPIARIAQMARAIGIHLILATQRPSREVITGIIKANFPSRIAFKVASRINSQIILDEVGAESLLGNGDLLFMPPGASHLVRAQGAYISDEEINKTIETICKKYPTDYLIQSFDNMKIENPKEQSSSGRDSLYDQALMIVLQHRNASTTFLQRKLKIGYARAASLMDELEENSIIGPQEGSKSRRILSDNDPSLFSQD